MIDTLDPSTTTRSVASPTVTTTVYPFARSLTETTRTDVAASRTGTIRVRKRTVRPVRRAWTVGALDFWL